jgi:glycosyltransferase involved in cell wall biosynthesis
MEASVSTPVVSVILPTFNRLRYLRPAVESVFAQSLADWELIVADDGSDGETRTYLETLEREARVTVLWLVHSGNPAAVRNAALRRARGQYLAFLDSDDEWLPRKLERQVESLRRSGRRWSYTGYAIVDASGEPCASIASPAQKQGSILEPLLMHDVSIWTPAVVAERRLVADAGGFDERLLVFEDYDLWLRLACRGEIDLIPEPYTRVRRSHDQHHSESNRGASMLTGWHHALGKIRGLVTDRGTRALVERLYAQSALNLVSWRADRDRSAAATLLIQSGARSWRCVYWWLELPRVLLKLAAPRGLLGLYRRSRVRRDSARTLSPP